MKINYKLTDNMVSLISDFMEYLTEITEYNKRHSSSASAYRILPDEKLVPSLTDCVLLSGLQMSQEQMYAMLSQPAPAGDPASEDVRFASNLLGACRLLNEINPLSDEALREVHGTLMDSLSPDASVYRGKNASGFRFDSFTGSFPSANGIPTLVNELLSWYKRSEVHPLIRTIVFFYGFESVHPFSDGNEMLGFLWMRALLGRWKKPLLCLPFETYIYRRRNEYHNIMNTSSSDCSRLIEFMLRIFYCALQDYDQDSKHARKVTPSMEKLLSVMKAGESYANRELMDLVGIRHRPTFRDNYLLPCIGAGMIEMTEPDKPNSRNQKYRLLMDD